MLNYTVRFWTYFKLDYKAAEKYLEKMARKGLVLVAMSDSGLPLAIYKKTKTTNLKFCICGPKDTRNQNSEEMVKTYEEYLKLVEDSGWKYVTASTGLIYFVSQENETPPPVYTDLKTEFLDIQRAYKRFDLKWVFIGVIAVLFLFIGIPAMDEGFSYLDFFNDIYGDFSRLTVGFTMIAGITMTYMIGFIRFISFNYKGQKHLEDERQSLGKCDNDAKCNNNEKCGSITKLWSCMYNAAPIIYVTFLIYEFVIKNLYNYYRETTNSLILLVMFTFVATYIGMYVFGDLENIDEKRANIWSKLRRSSAALLLISIVAVWIMSLYIK